jgi:hypothetical protein
MLSEGEAVIEGEEVLPLRPELLRNGCIYVANAFQAKEDNYKLIGEVKQKIDTHEDRQRPVVYDTTKVN